MMQRMRSDKPCDQARSPSHLVNPFVAQAEPEGIPLVYPLDVPSLHETHTPVAAISPEGRTLH